MGENCHISVEFDNVSIFGLISCLIYVFLSFAFYVPSIFSLYFVKI